MRPKVSRAPTVLAAAAIAAQIAWPLTSGNARVINTSIVVALFAAASVLHAADRRGLRWAIGYTLIALAVGLGVEVLGTSTGFPFSEYAYTDALSPQLLGVPALIPVAWTMMAYPAWLVGRRLAGGRIAAGVVVGAFALASWDVFLDPQMVNEGYWVWLSDQPGLPGIEYIPLVNYAGWLLVSLVLIGAITLLPTARNVEPWSWTAEGVPALLYGWTWLGGIVANAIFLGRPAVAAWGGILMGIVAVPYLFGVLRDGLRTTASSARAATGDRTI